MHTSTFYKAIKRLRNKACTIPEREQKTVSLRQEIFEVASIDNNGVITQPQQIETVAVSHKDQSLALYDNRSNTPVFETTVQIVMPSGMRVELSNNTNAATIRNVLSVLRSV